MCTGLSQVSHSKNQYYYRLKNHRNFFDFLSIPYVSIQPRMTRDFLVKFKNCKQAKEVKSYLQTLSFNNKQIFGLIELRDKELFITLDYNSEINQKSIIECSNFQNSEFVSFDLFIILVLWQLKTENILRKDFFIGLMKKNLKYQ